MALFLYNRFLLKTLVFCCLLLLPSFSAPLSANAKPLIIGYSHYPPFQWTNSHGQAVGLDIDIISAVLDDSGYSSLFKKMPWTRQLQVGIKNGELDILLQAKRTYAREDFAYFSNQMYMHVNNAMFIRKEDSAKFRHIQNLRDITFNDISLGVVRGSVYSEEHQQLLSNPKFLNRVVDLSKDEQSINMLLSGRIDAFLATDLSVAHLLTDNQQRNTIALHIYLNEHDQLNQGSLFMFSKATMNPGQIERINQSLAKLLTNGTIANILSKYGFSVLTPP